MLKAMKQQLQTLSESDQQNFHLNLRKRVGKKATAVLEDRLREIIVLMPDLVRRIYHYWNTSKKDSKVKKMGGYLLTYLYTPEDFLSTSEWGLFGYLDDAYFVAKMYTQVIEEIQEANGTIAGQDMAYYDKAKYLKRYVRGVIPNEAKKIDEMIFELKNGKRQIFEEIFT